MKKYLLIGITILLMSGNCKNCESPVIEPSPSLPDYSVDGRNTIGSKMNDIVWVSTANLSSKFTDKSSNVAVPIFSIKGETSISSYRTLNFSVEHKDLPKIGKFSMTKISYQDTNLGQYLFIDKMNPPIVDFTKFDPTTSIASGKFEGVIYTDSTKKSPLKISEGRFDVKYITNQ